MPNVMVTLPNIAQCRKVWSRPLLERHAVTLPTGQRKTWRTQSEFCTWQNSVTGQQLPKMYTKCTSPGKGHTLCKVWLASVERCHCSNEAKTQKPLRLAGVPQTNEAISAANGLKFTIFQGHVGEILLLNKFFSDC